MLRAIIRAASTNQAGDRAIPLAAAQLVSKRWVGLVEVPSELQHALESVTAGLNGEEGRHLSRASRRLLLGLRANSRTAARGGVNVNETTVLDPTSGLRRRPKKRPAAPSLRDWRNGAVVAFRDESDDEDGEAGRPAAAAPAEAAEDASSGNHGPGYDTAEAAAYAASRFPACYAVLHKVMEELQLRLPGFSPTRMLDFGAGPGTAIWAATSVWGGDALKTVHAVEKATPMLALGHGCHQALRAVQPATPSVRWSRRLSPRPSDSRLASQRYDLVVASYVLAELRSPSERRKVVQALWERTGGLLLLVEPGTPVGSANIREARTQVLTAERRISSRLASDETPICNAHVVAPCPHDGGCPMDGAQSWCHFAQRFQRTNLQKRTKTLPGGAKPRDYQDERFSYVILRRSPRPAAPSLQLQIHDAAGVSAPEFELLEREAVGDDDFEALNESLAEHQPGPPDAETLQLILESIQGDSDEDDDDEAEEADAFAHSVVESLSQPGAAAEDATTEGGSSPGTGGGSGSIAAGRHACRQPSGSGSERGTDVPTQPAVPQHGDTSAELAEVEMAPEVDAADPTGSSSEDVAAAVAASGSWSRIIRPPRKKSGHVVLDLCSAGRNGATPQLEQQVVSRGSSGGAPYHRFARKARWGDLWPVQRRTACV